jgi:hypothetical protein
MTEKCNDIQPQLTFRYVVLHIIWVQLFRIHEPVHTLDGNTCLEKIIPLMYSLAWQTRSLVLWEMVACTKICSAFLFTGSINEAASSSLSIFQFKALLYTNQCIFLFLSDNIQWDFRHAITFVLFAFIWPRY